MNLYRLRSVLYGGSSAGDAGSYGSGYLWILGQLYCYKDAYAYYGADDTRGRCSRGYSKWYQGRSLFGIGRSTLRTFLLRLVIIYHGGLFFSRIIYLLFSGGVDRRKWSLASYWGLLCVVERYLLW